MPDHPGSPFTYHSSPDDDEDWRLVDARDDGRLLQLVYVDGRLVESSVASVARTRWEHHARRFDEQRRALESLSPPPHERVLTWLDSLVGGRSALCALTVDPAAPPRAPTFEDAPSAACFGAILGHLDRVTAAFFDDEVGAVLAWAVHTLAERRSRLFTSAASANHLAGGVVWVVGRANDLFTGGVTQQRIKERLGLGQSLTVAGRRVVPVLRGITLTIEDPPPGAPDLMPLAEPALLTPTTRGIVIDWRDRALEAAES